MLFYRKRNRRARGEDGERQAQEGPKTAHHLLELPARGAAEEVPEHTVPRAARESRARGVSGSHTNTGTRPIKRGSHCISNRCSCLLICHDPCRA